MREPLDELVLAIEDRLVLWRYPQPIEMRHAADVGQTKDLAGEVGCRNQRPGDAREYHLTEKGGGLKAVIIALNDWGDRWLQPGPIDYIHRGCGGLIKQSVACECCAKEVPLDEVGVRPRSS